MEVHTHQLPYTGMDLASVEAAAAAVSADVAAAAESATRLLRISCTCGFCCCCCIMSTATAVLGVFAAPCAAALTSKTVISGSNKLLLGPLLLLLGLLAARDNAFITLDDMIRSVSIQRDGEETMFELQCGRTQQQLELLQQQLHKDQQTVRTRCDDDRRV